MPAQPRAVTQIREFPGVVSNVDAHDAPPGAAEEQVNVCSIESAQLQTRGGLREVSFES